MKLAALPRIQALRLGVERGGAGDWEVKKLKHISSIQFSNVDNHTVEGERPVRLCNYVDVYHHEFITTDLNFMEARHPLRYA